jgi:hypothetical protein
MKHLLGKCLRGWIVFGVVCGVKSLVLRAAGGGGRALRAALETRGPPPRGLEEVCFTLAPAGRRGASVATMAAVNLRVSVEKPCPRRGSARQGFTVGGAL